mgnify:FL=1
MKSILLDLNIIFDVYNNQRRQRFPESIEAYEYILATEGYQGYISSSSLDNLEFIKISELSRERPELSKSQIKSIVHSFIKELVATLKLAKTPSYMEIDYEDIEDSQIISSVKAVNAVLITRDVKLLKKHPSITITPQDFMAETQKNTRHIDFANLKKQYNQLQPQIEQQIDEVLNTTSFIMGGKVKELEVQLQHFTHAKHAITCSSGTDALLLAMMAMGIQPDDEIITTPFTFIATAETIALMKAKPVFVDIDEATFNIDPSKIEAAITAKTKAIMPVGLYGQPADMDEINAIAKKHNLKVIIDGAQSFGATYKEQSEVHHCDIFTTSFFPAKPLGCYGDGGAVFTNNDDYAERIKMMRVHGQNKRYHHKYIGMGGRLDTIQAAVLLAKLPHYESEIKARQNVANKYNSLLKNQVTTPPVKEDRTSVWAQYTVRVNNREDLQVKLKDAGIPTAVHYPMPLHLQECFQYLGLNEGDFPIAEQAAREVMSMPMNPFLKNDEIDYICKYFNC